MQNVYLTKECARLLRRSGVADDDVIEAVNRAEAGKIDADLGGGLIKQRVARAGQGRSGGFRTVIAYRRGERAIFLHMFAKSRQANLSPAELEAYRRIAGGYDELSDEQLEAIADASDWRRIEI